MLPKYKVQILDNIYLDEVSIGYVMGNNLKEIDFEDEDEIERFVNNILKAELEDVSTLYIEGCDRFSKEVLTKIQDLSKLQIPTGETIRFQNLDLLLIRITKLLNRELYKNDLLIICDDKNRLLETIKILPKELNCIANVGIMEDNLYEEVLKATGVSIYLPTRMEKAIKNFHIIINYSDEILFDTYNIRNQGVVIDYSSHRALKEVERLNKNIVYIEDFSFPSKLNSKWINKSLSSKLYESIYGDKIEKFRQIYTEDDYWYLEEYIDSKIKKRGRL